MEQGISIWVTGWLMNIVDMTTVLQARRAEIPILQAQRSAIPQPGPAARDMSGVGFAA